MNVKMKCIKSVEMRIKKKRIRNRQRCQVNALMQQMESNRIEIIRMRTGTWDNAINSFQYTIKLYVFARLLLQLIPAHSRTLYSTSLAHAIFIYLLLFLWCSIVRFHRRRVLRACSLLPQHLNLGFGKHCLQFVSLHTQYLIVYVSLCVCVLQISRYNIICERRKKVK